MKLIPLYNKSIVEIIPDSNEQSKTAGGIILVNKQTPYYKGKVISVGKGHYQNAQRIAMDVEEGQTILFLKNSGMAVDFDSSGNPTQVLLADTDIYAIVEE
jgi:co-chaperonin GroES (HSP10)